MALVRLNGKVDGAKQRGDLEENLLRGGKTLESKMKVYLPEG